MSNWSLQRRSPPGLAVVTAAILLASTGSAVAAKLITSSDIKDGTIRLADLSRGARIELQGGRGPQGVPGKPGASAEHDAPGGRAGSLGAVVVRYGTPVVVPKAGPVVREAFANCLPGEKAVGGGAKMTDDPSDPPLPNQAGPWHTFLIDSGPITTPDNSIPANRRLGGTSGLVTPRARSPVAQTATR
jgi:hypothetical protein